MPNEQSRMKRRKQLNKKKKPVWKIILLSIALLFVLSGVAVAGVFTYYIATAPRLDPEKLSDPFSAKIYDKSGEVIAEFGTEKRTKIEYDDLPEILIDAVTATEDVRFFKHRGIDLRRIGGAIKANITRGFGAEGASTITQQVVEHAFLTPEKKIKYKVQEQWLALKLEREYSKEQILEMYLNKIFYGSNAYGVAKAAEVYFGKTDLHELTLPEAAILAGLPQRPSAYNPYVNPDLMEKRMDTVLKLMVRHKKISEEEAEEARQVDIESLLAGQPKSTMPYEGFVQKVRKELEDKLDVNLETDGVEVYTTLDPSIQKHVEFLMTDSDDNPIPYPDDDMKTGMTVVNTQTGEILAIGGQRNSENLDGFNYAFQGGGFQPGSTVKPIMSYGPAIEYNKISTCHQLNDDKPYEVAGTSPIRNWNRQYQGWMSARYALTHSLNVPTVKLVDETGLANAQEFAEGLGIKFHEDQINIRDAIGGTETNVTPVQLAGAFSAFGNEGIYHEPYTVTKVVYPDGKETNLASKPEVAMSDYTAYIVTDMLKSVVKEGTGTAANISGLPMAGKTGTTNLADQTGAPDAWFVGYTTNFTISVWAGGYEDEEGKRTVIPGNGTQIPRLLFKETMSEISKDIQTTDFIKPSSVVEVEVEKGTNPPKLPSDFTPTDKIVKELFVKGHEPKEVSDEFDQLDPVKNLSVTYDEPTNSLEVTWDYDIDDETDVEFEVSASIDGQAMKELATTSDHNLTISEVEEGAEYTIQVVVVRDELKSDPVSTKYIIPEKEVEIEPVTNLTADYDEDKNVIHVSWDHSGPIANFDIVVNPGDFSTVISDKRLEITNIEQGTTYTITVTPISRDSDAYGDAMSVNIKIPIVEIEEPNETEPPDKDENNDDHDENNPEEPEEPGDKTED